MSPTARPTRPNSGRAATIYSIVMPLLLAGVAWLSIACGGDPPGVPSDHVAQPSQPTQAALPPAPSAEEIEVPRPPFSEGIFPCSECHKDIKPNPQPRKLVDAHDEIVLKHGPDRWCLDCHNLDNRDVLRLASGKLIDFSHSYLLCGQCHGDKFRDWRVGVHGKRTGEWNGRKQYLLCVHCHNPHSPRFQQLQPMPPPNKPLGGRANEGGRS